MPSIPSSCSSDESRNAAVVNGARPSQVATKQKV